MGRLSAARRPLTEFKAAAIRRRAAARHSVTSWPGCKHVTVTGPRSGLSRGHGVELSFQYPSLMQELRAGRSGALDNH